MFVNERHLKIVSLLRQRKRVTVADLSSELAVSRVTIRKDLEYLEQEGHLIRTFGGALYCEPELPRNRSCFIPPESMDDYSRKQTIGTLAADLIRDEDYIFLGPGYTCLEVAKNLKSKNRLSIVTMNISAAIELADTPEFKIITVPGDFTKRNGTYYVTGSQLFDYFSDTFFDKIFITIDGISLTRGFSVFDRVTARIFQSLIPHTTEVVVCATNIKFNKNAMALLGPLTIANTIVTDEPMPADFQEYFDRNNIHTICRTV